MNDMMLVWVLLGWDVLSVPVSLVFGEMLRGATYDPLPRWSADDERQLAQWSAWRDRDQLAI